MKKWIRCLVFLCISTGIILFSPIYLEVKADLDYYNSMEEVTVDGIIYHFLHYNEGIEVEIMGYDEEKIAEHLVIPEKVPGYDYKIRNIASYAFACSRKIKSVEIQAPISYMGTGVFYACTELEKVTIGADVRDIGRIVFIGCSSLKEIVVNPESEKFFIYKGALYKKNEGGGTIEINENEDTPLKYQLICYPYARMETTFTLMANSVYSPIFDFFHYGNPNIRNIVLEDDKNYTVVDGVLFSKDMKTLYYYPAGKSDTSYQIPDGVKTIKPGAFYNAVHLKELYVPDSVIDVSYAHGDYTLGTLDNAENCIDFKNYDRVLKLNPNFMVYCGKTSEIYKLAEKLVWHLEDEDENAIYGLNLNGVYYVKEKIKMDDINVASIPPKSYTGTEIEPTIQVIHDGKELKNEIDYTMNFENNKEIGMATITIIGKGTYSGTKTITFEIVPQKIKLKNIKSNGKKAVVTWPKQDGVSGYEIYMSKSKQGKYKKVETITNSSTTKYTTDTLSEGKKYYFKIRAYKDVNGQNWYGDYSSLKSVSINQVKIKNPKLYNIKMKNGKAILTWKRQKDVSGYIIYMSNNKKGTYKTVIRIKKSSTTKYTTNTLENGKTYYFKMRPYKNVKGKKVYGNDSKVKSVKIKK